MIAAKIRATTQRRAGRAAPVMRNSETSARVSTSAPACGAIIACGVDYVPSYTTVLYEEGTDTASAPGLGGHRLMFHFELSPHTEEDFAKFRDEARENHYGPDTPSPFILLPLGLNGTCPIRRVASIGPR